MSDPDLIRLAQIHASCFSDRPRAWTAPEMGQILQTKGSFLLSRPDAFLIGRVIADEAELLTVATAPTARRQGLAQGLLCEFMTISAQRGAVSAYLEVLADNLAALALYRSNGWVDAGQRRDYYGPGYHATILTRGLAPT